MSLGKATELWNDLKRKKLTSLDDFKAIEQGFAKIEREVDSAGGLDGFFETVGRGLVQAQESLDLKSDEYISRQQGFPTVFRIPKVTAQIKFAASKRSGAGFAARIFTRTEQEEEETSHSLSFDVVAASPPPEMVQQLLPRFLESIVVADLLTRSRLQFALESHLSGIPNSPNKTRLQRFKKDFDRLVIFRHSQGWALVNVIKEDDAHGMTADIAYVEGDLDGPGATFGFDSSKGVKKAIAREVPILRKLLSWMIDFADEQEQRLQRAHSRETRS